MINVIMRKRVSSYFEIEEHISFKRKGIKYWLYILKNRKYIVSIEKEK